MSHPELRGIGLAEMSRERMRAFIAAGPMPWRPRVIANGVAALVGDAAGYIEPFTGEGMSWAIEGALALGAVAGSLRPGAWNAAAASHWTGMWNDRIRRRQVICNSLSHALERPRVARMLLRTGSMWPGLARRIAGRVVAS